MPKKKTIPPPDDFSSEFMETESAKELSEQQVRPPAATTRKLRWQDPRKLISAPAM